MPRDWRRAAHVFVLSTFLAVCAVAALAQQQQPQIGMAPVAISPGPYTFDTAEQHRLRVVVVTKGLVHPFSRLPSKWTRTTALC